MKKTQISKKGFSLIEVLISLLILSTGIAAVVLLMMQSIRSSQTARDQIIASMLAQEGIELMRNYRDNKTSSFNTTGITSAENDCRMDITMGAINLSDFLIDCNVNSEKGLYLSGNFFSHTVNGTAKFYRKIDIVSSGGALTLTSTVIWNGIVFPAPVACNVGNSCVSIVSVMPD